MQRHRSQGCAAAGFAVQHRFEVTWLQSPIGAELELKHTTPNVDGAGQVTNGKYIGFARIHQHFGIMDGLPCLFNAIS